MKPKIEEYMVFEDINGEMGVILKSDYSDNNPWWKCYKDSMGGDIFKQNSNDQIYNKIVKLFKSNEIKNENKIFDALKFMNNGNLKNYNCVYEYVELVEEIKPVSIMINLTLNDTNIIENIYKQIAKELIGKSALIGDVWYQIMDIRIIDNKIEYSLYSRCGWIPEEWVKEIKDRNKK